MSPSLLKSQTSSYLNEVISKKLHSDPGGVVELKGSGFLFTFVLEYLEDAGHVVLPKTVSKIAFLAELSFYGIKGFDSSKIVNDFSSAYRSQKEFRVNIRIAINSWDVHVAILTLAKKCALSLLRSPGVLKINVERKPSFDDTFTCPVEMWKALLCLLDEGEEKKFVFVRDACNQFLRDVGLKIVRFTTYPDLCVLTVLMVPTDMSDEDQQHEMMCELEQRM